MSARLADPARAGGAARAWGWVASLREGGTTPWSRWPDATAGSAGPTAGPTTARPGPTTGVPTARDLPGAQQLELLRRVNLARSTGAGRSVGAAGATTAGERVLTERILAASATGRGTTDLDLVGAREQPAWGPRPVDPESLPDADLLRIAAALVAEDVLAADLLAAGRRSPLALAQRFPRGARRRLRSRRRGHRLVGDPWLVAAAREEMLRRGRPLGGPRSTTVVVGADVATMLVDAYTARAFDAGVAPWDRFVAGVSGGALPRRADLAAVTRRWVDEVGAAHVVVVPDPALVPRALGLSARALARTTPVRPSADAVDLARGVAPALGLLVAPPERRRLLRQVLLPMVLADDVSSGAPGLAVPAAHLPWLVERAERMRDDLLAAGYPVVGDLQGLVPSAGDRDASGAGPVDAGVLALAIRLLLGSPSATRTQEKENRR